MPASSQPIRWVYPSDGHTSWEPQMLLVGSVPPGSTLQVTGAGNQQGLVQVSSKGYFSASVPLSAQGHTTTLTLTVVLPSGQNITETRTIHHPHPKVALSPRLMVPEEQSQPLDVWGGVAVPVRFEGLSGQGVVCEWVNAQGQTVASQTLSPVAESPDALKNVFGQLHQLSPALPPGFLAEALIRVPLEPVVALQWSVHGTDVHRVAVHWHSQPWSRVLVTHDSALNGRASIVLRAQPSTDSPRLTPQWPGTQVSVVAEWGQWACIQLERQHTAWVLRENLNESVPEEGLAVYTLRSVRQQVAADDAVILTVGGQANAARLPIEWEVSSTDARLTLHQSGVACDVLPQPQLAGQWPYIHVSAVNDGSAVPHARVQYQAPEGRVLSGMSVAPVTGGGWQWQLRHFPNDKNQWRIVLDAGHGGGEWGGVAPNGVPEKTLNLAVTLACAQALASVGFQHIHLTRTTDVEVSLADRVAQAADFNPHVVLSLHHNALPDGRNPAHHRGVSTFYYYPQARPLAAHLLGALPPSVGLPSDRLYWDNLALTRIPDAASVLVEWGYLTHPGDADVFLDAAFPQKAAQALAQAMVSFQP